MPRAGRGAGRARGRGRAGCRPDTDPQLAGEALHAYVTGIMQSWVQNPAAYDLAAAAPALIDAMLAGLRRRAAASRGRRATPAAVELSALHPAPPHSAPA